LNACNIRHANILYRRESCQKTHLSHDEAGREIKDGEAG
jgi:hypothetical protein